MSDHLASAIRVAEQDGSATLTLKQLREIAAAVVPEGSSATMPVGSRVRKHSGYPFPGEVRAAFTNRAGDLRYVVEATGADYVGMLHIFSPAQLALPQEKEPGP